METVSSVWSQVKSRIKSSLPVHKYNMWIEPVQCVTHDSKSLCLFAPNTVFIQRLKEHYMPMIKKELKELDSQVSIQFTTEFPENLSGLPLKINGQPSSTLQKEQSLGDLGHTVPKRKPNEYQSALPGFEKPFYKSRLLKKNYTFDNFVVGDNSNFAYNASLSLAKGQLNGTSILYLLGKTGLGKSHLSQAAGQHILSSQPRSRVYYITAEDFTNEMIYSLQQKTIEKFKKKYRKYCDTLILEDVHFLAGKKGTQKELVLTLDYLLDADKKIIFSGCDCPKEIPKLDPQLTSRLSMGLITELKIPDFATRFKILEKKSRTLDCRIPKEVLEFLAQELNKDVRQLKSGLFGVSAKAVLLNRKVDIKLAESVVWNMVEKSQSITLDSIKNLICSEFSITQKQLLSKTRKQDIVRPRQIAMFLARKYTDLPLKQIGAGFNRYHATALYAMNSIEKQLQQKGQIYKQISYLSEKLEKPMS